VSTSEHRTPRTTIDHVEVGDQAPHIREVAMSTTGPEQPSSKTLPIPSIQDIFGDTPPLQSAEDLAQEGIFVDDNEVDDFLTDLYAMRRTDVA
jgi:hypothetical protein